MSFKNLINVKNIYLNNNQLHYLNSSTFDGLQKLKKLYLNGNKLKEINFLNGLINLEFLNMEKNEISAVDLEMFKKIKFPLLKFCISYNHLPQHIENYSKCLLNCHANFRENYSY